MQASQLINYFKKLVFFELAIILFILMVSFLKQRYMKLINMNKADQTFIQRL